MDFNMMNNQMLIELALDQVADYPTYLQGSDRFSLVSFGLLANLGIGAGLRFINCSL